MSGQLESALVLELVDAIKWEAALAPLDSKGALNPVNLDTPLDVVQYSRRDRELAFRDLINAAAIIRVSLEAETVWNAPAIRPRVEGVTTEVLPFVPSDLGQGGSYVAHVKQTSVPKDALVTDKDLASRDALIYEVLARACQIFTDPPISPNDATGTVIPNQSAWSLAEGVATPSNVNSALPLNRELFKNPDTRLAGRDNEVVAYASSLVKILQNPFAYASRIYVNISGVDAREIETYTVIRVYWDVNANYDLGAEVYFNGVWWVAAAVTSGEEPGTGPSWQVIAAPSKRVFVAEPAYSNRNRIVYDVAQKTLQWTSETATNIHPPQIFALSIPGALPGQVITTVPEVPQAQDAQFWRQKAARISYEGTLTHGLEGYNDSTVFHAGQAQTDTIGFTAPTSMTIPLTTTLVPSNRYKFSMMVKPSQTVDIFGAFNQQTVSGTLSGATFGGVYEPTDAAPGQPISFSLLLPAGNWTVALGYTNLGNPTDGFGVKMALNGIDILQDASPLLFQDEQGNHFPPGRLVESNPVNFISSGGVSLLTITWTYGAGIFHLRTLHLETHDRNISRYSMLLNVLNTGGASTIVERGVSIPAIDSFGERRQYAVMPFEFSVSSVTANPRMVVTLVPVDTVLPLQTRQFELEQVVHTLPVPEVGGFLSWKQECLDRAHRGVNTAFNTFISFHTDADMPDFTLDGTLWDKTSSDKWMAAMETYQPRLREAKNVTDIVSGRQYQVKSGSVVYNGGTFAATQKFYGTNVSSFTSFGATVDQVGAFMLSLPGHVGRPCLVPLGLYFDGIVPKQANPTKQQVPTIAALQPWMMEAGIYTAQEDFWVPLNNQDSEEEVPAPFAEIIRMKVSPIPLSVGFVDQGDTGTGAWTVQNIGNTFFSGVVSLNTGSFSIASGGSYALYPGQTQTTKVVYTPTESGSAVGQVVWNDSAFSSFSGAQAVTSDVFGTSSAFLCPVVAQGDISWTGGATGSGLVSYLPARMMYASTNSQAYYTRVSSATQQVLGGIDLHLTLVGGEVHVDTKFGQVFLIDQLGRYVFVDPETDAILSGPTVTGFTLSTPGVNFVAYDHDNGIMVYTGGNTPNEPVFEVNCATRLASQHTGQVWTPAQQKCYNSAQKKVWNCNLTGTTGVWAYDTNTHAVSAVPGLNIGPTTDIYYDDTLNVAAITDGASKIYIVDGATNAILDQTNTASGGLNGIVYNACTGKLMVATGGFGGRMFLYDPTNWSSTSVTGGSYGNIVFDPYAGCAFTRMVGSRMIRRNPPP